MSATCAYHVVSHVVNFSKQQWLNDPFHTCSLVSSLPIVSKYPSQAGGPIRLQLWPQFINEQAIADNVQHRIQQKNLEPQQWQPKHNRVPQLAWLHHTPVRNVGERMIREPWERRIPPGSIADMQSTSCLHATSRRYQLSSWASLYGCWCPHRTSKLTPQWPLPS
jgi:hypothetical protein